MAKRRLGLFRFLARMVRGPEIVPPCEHPNLKQQRWLASDGTPMAQSSCPDCGLFDYGHVHADPNTWLQSGG